MTSYISYLNPFSYFGATTKPSESKNEPETGTNADVPLVPTHEAEIAPRLPQAHSFPRFESAFEFGEDDGEDCSTAHFHLSCDAGITLKFSVMDLQTDRLEKDWIKIFTECPSTKLRLASGAYGDITIDVAETVTTFLVSKYGGDGIMTVTIPNTLALPVLQDSYNAWAIHKRVVRQAAELAKPKPSQ